MLNGIPQGLLALSMGFASVPTALGFGVGVIGCLPVSYTHLDVYKRQPKGVGALYVRRGYNLAPVFLGGGQAVSYTHLDVYKRQATGCAG